MLKDAEDREHASLGIAVGAELRMGVTDLKNIVTGLALKEALGIFPVRAQNRQVR